MRNHKPTIVGPWIALAIACAVEIVVFVCSQSDFVAADPLWYSDVAHRLSVSPADVFASHDTHPFIMRIGLTMPLALLYRLFGVSTLVSNLPCLLSVLGLLVVIYAAAPSPRAKVIAMILVVFSAPVIQQAHVLNIDLPAAVLMAASVLGLSRRTRARGRAWLIAAVAAWFAAFLVKETALWCAVVWIYAIAVDLRANGARSTLRTYAPALITGTALAIGYLVLCDQLWGDPLARFHGIQDLTFEHAWSLHGMPARAWIDRLTWQAPLGIAQLYQALLVPVVLAPWWVRGPERIWWFATAAFGLLYWFGSSSLSAYTPLPINARMMLPLLPGLLVLAAVVCDRVLERLSRPRGLAIAVGLAIAIGVPAGYALVVAIRRPAPETDGFAFVRAEAAGSGGLVVVVCADPRCVPIGNFYLEFEIPPNVRVVHAIEFARGPRPHAATVRAMVNRRRGANEADRRVDLGALIDALELPQLVGTREVHLLDAGDGGRLWDQLQGIR